ncbi:hypothetical protein IWX63_003326 [Arthrobacter sp. CAN_A2]
MATPNGSSPHTSPAGAAPTELSSEVLPELDSTPPEPASPDPPAPAPAASDETAGADEDRSAFTFNGFSSTEPHPAVTRAHRMTDRTRPVLRCCVEPTGILQYFAFTIMHARRPNWFRQANSGRIGRHSACGSFIVLRRRRAISLVCPARDTSPPAAFPSEKQCADESVGLTWRQGGMITHPRGQAALLPKLWRIGLRNMGCSRISWEVAPCLELTLPVWPQLIRMLS